MKYFLIAGEASGDMHAARLIRSLRQTDASAQFVGMGGMLMQQEGCRLVQNYENMAFMGVIAVLKNLSAVRRNFAIAKQTLLHEQPDALILIDYPTFNLKIAKFCRRHLPLTKIYYYIPPKVWAWKSWRVHRIARYTDKVLAIFPFEPAFYARYGYKAEYMGNPTMDAIREWKKECATDMNSQLTAINGNSQSPNTLAVLPGSRKHEIEKCLPKMLTAARRIQADMPDLRIVVLGAPGVHPNFYHQFLRGETILFGQTYDVVAQARAAIVNSGTATLETALLGCPQVAVYHIAMGRLVGLFRDLLFKIPHFTLVNIIAGKEVIQEKIAYLFTVDEVEKETHRLLTDNRYRQQMEADYCMIANRLGNAIANDNAARTIISDLQS